MPKELPVLDESVPASQPVQSNPYGALAAHESEFNLAVEVGFECQKRKAAELALAEIQRCLPYVEPGMVLAMTKWAQRVQQRLDQRNPIDGVIHSIRQASEVGNRSTW